MALALPCAWSFLGCSGSAPPSDPIPEDCQAWLTTYYDAYRNDELDKIAELSSTVSARDVDRMSADGVESMHEARRRFAQDLMQRFSSELGELKSYSVEYCKETAIDKGSPGANAFGVGRHVEIICNARYSKKTANERFALYKNPADTDWIVDAHSVSYPP